MITIISCLTYQWFSRATNSIIKRRHTKPYKRKISSNNVECSTSTGLYCTTRDVKVTFCMPEFSCRKITLHRLHVDKNEDELGIGYDMIIAHDLMVKLGLSAVFKRQFLQLDGVTVPMKEPRGLL